jgi:hypothetical protein
LQSYGEFEAHGSLQKVQIAIPWAQLTRSPLRVKITGASIVINVNPGGWNDAAIDPHKKQVPQEQLLRMDELFRRQWQRLLRDGAAASPGKKRSFGARMIERLIGRMYDNGL